MRAKLILLISLVTLPSWADTAADPSGLWNTFDDKGNIESTVEVRVQEGKLYANILSLHNAPEDKIRGGKKQDRDGRPFPQGTGSDVGRQAEVIQGVKG